VEERVKLLLVEDSRAVATFIELLLRGERDIELLAPVADGLEAVARVQRHHPNLVLMDLELPGLDGVEAIKQIMATAPCPIVVLSGRLEVAGRDRTFESLQAGAVDVLAKPSGVDEASVSEFRKRLLRTVRVMSQARVVARKPSGERLPAVRPAAQPAVEPVQPAVRPAVEPVLAAVQEGAVVKCGLVAIGGSTGAPPLVYELLRALPVPAPFPVVVVQHIIPGFEPGFARWLGRTGHATQVVGGGEVLEAGKVYVAPADGDLALGGARLVVRPPTGLTPPSVDVFFASVAESPLAGRTLALLLTGMGEDGARGLLALRRMGALTVTQERSSCVVDGMPGAARALGGSCQAMLPQEMGVLLGALARGAAFGGKEGASRGQEPPGEPPARASRFR
jgi:two-component system chemotaxis response regulator CheB